MTATALRPIDLPDALLARGQHTVTVPEAGRLLGRSESATRSALQRLSRSGRVFLAGRDLYVVIPPQYRSWGVLPAAQFIDALMAVRHRRYYVGLLSAAELHGAAHQAPQVFQVVVDRPLAGRDLERVRLRFHVGSHLVGRPDEGVVTRNVPTGTMRVSSPELTAVDLVDYLRAAGGLDNVATVLSEMDHLDGVALAALAGRRDRAVRRRLGWLLERVENPVDLGPLRESAEPGAGAPTPLRPGMGGRGHVHPEWGVRVDADVDPDL